MAIAIGAQDRDNDCHRVAQAGDFQRVGRKVAANHGKCAMREIHTRISPIMIDRPIEMMKRTIPYETASSSDTKDCFGHHAAPAAKSDRLQSISRSTTPRNVEGSIHR